MKARDVQPGDIWWLDREKGDSVVVERKHVTRPQWAAIEVSHGTAWLPHNVDLDVDRPSRTAEFNVDDIRVLLNPSRPRPIDVYTRVAARLAELDAENQP